MAEFNNNPYQSNVNKGKSKKKKKNFMSHTKSCAKQGFYGLGVELKQDEYDFFMTISENLKTISKEEKGK